MTRKRDPRTTRLPVKDIVESGGELPPFTPVPRRCARHDGWTPERQIAFIEALADTGSVQAASKAVNMSAEGAYNLRRQPGAETFRKAWEAALQLGVARVEDVVMDRALNGVEEPLYSYGKLIGTRRRYNDRLLMFILRNRAPERFADGAPKALNAIGRMELERHKKQWRKEWEAEQRNVTPAEVRASIERKIIELRTRIERERPRRRAVLSEETLAAFAHFAQLRDRDLAAQNADERTVQLVKTGLDTPTTHFDPPEPLRLVGPEKPTEQNGDWQGPPEGWRAKKLAPPPKTVWTLKDDSFDP